MSKRGVAPMVKVVVWDLDDTLWDGALVEGSAGVPRQGIVEVVRELDSRGVLQSVASKNDAGMVKSALRVAELDEFFLYPQVSWGAKSAAIRRIVDKLNVGIDTVLFVDDDPFERAEVRASYPVVRCIDSQEALRIVDRPDIPRPDPGTGMSRRELYLSEEWRQERESAFVGTKAEFLATLDLELQIREAALHDLSRVEELITRTNQLNTTGIAFSHDELTELITDPAHAVLVLDLKDQLGDYGTIGVVVVHRSAVAMRLRLFLLSCRVMGRNLVPVIVRELSAAADAVGVPLVADFVGTEVNRPMYVAYRFAGFQEDPGHVDERAAKVLRLAVPPLAQAVAHVRVLSEATMIATTKGRLT